MLEIEMKFTVDDFALVEQTLQQWRADGPHPRRDADRYFNAPDRDFAKTDEALRLRTIAERSWITYKGPKTDALTKTRFELEIPLATEAGTLAAFQQLLQHLGYRFVALVEKQRTIYHLQRAGFDVEVCLDVVADLGQFVEVEIVAPEDQLEAGRATLQEIARELHLTCNERRAYLQMLLEKR